MSGMPPLLLPAELEAAGLLGLDLPAPPPILTENVCPSFSEKSWVGFGASVA